MPGPLSRIVLLACASVIASCAVPHDVHTESDGTFTIEVEDPNGLTGFDGLGAINSRRATAFCAARGQGMVPGRIATDGAVFFMGTASELHFRCS